MTKPTGNEALFLREFREHVDLSWKRNLSLSSGAATSDSSGKPRTLSDWEYELVRQLKTGVSEIPQAEVTALPRFLQKKELYIARSAYLSQNMLRFSLDFARLCPSENQFDEVLMDEYIETLLLIKASRQEPFLTFHHFTMPKYLVTINSKGNITAGGWEIRWQSHSFVLTSGRQFALWLTQTGSAEY